MMMRTVKRTISSIGDRGGDLAEDFASGTVDLAKRFGSGTASIAKRVGPRRGLLGLAVIAAAVGGSVMLIRYLKSRTRNIDPDASADQAWPGAPAKTNYGSHVRPANATNVPPGTH